MKLCMGMFLENQICLSLEQQDDQWCSLRAFHVLEAVYFEPKHWIWKMGSRLKQGLLDRENGQVWELCIIADTSARNGIPDAWTTKLGPKWSSQMKVSEPSPIMCQLCQTKGFATYLSVKSFLQVREQSEECAWTNNSFDLWYTYSSIEPRETVFMEQILVARSGGGGGEAGMHRSS